MTKKNATGKDPVNTIPGEENANLSPDNVERKEAEDQEDDDIKEVELINEDLPEDKGGVKKFARKHAERLLAYEEKHGFSNWKIKEGQNLTHSNGRISRGNNKEAPKPE